MSPWAGTSTGDVSMCDPDSLIRTKVNKLYKEGEWWVTISNDNSQELENFCKKLAKK